MNDTKLEQPVQWLRLLQPVFNTDHKSKRKRRSRRFMIMAVPTIAIIFDTTALAAPTTDYTVTDLTTTIKMAVGSVIWATDATCLTEIDPNQPNCSRAQHSHASRQVYRDASRG